MKTREFEFDYPEYGLAVSGRYEYERGEPSGWDDPGFSPEARVIELHVSVLERDKGLLEAEDIDISAIADPRFIQQVEARCVDLEDDL